MRSDDPWNLMHGFDSLDRSIAQALQIDGRAPFSRIAQVLGVSDQTVARRYARLRGSGAVRVLGLPDPLRLGITPWLVRVRCTPDAAGSVAEALARRADTRWVSLISGGTEISCMVHGAEPGQGDALLLQKLPRTPRVVQVSAHALLHVFFGRELSPVSRSGPLGPAELAALAPEDGRRADAWQSASEVGDPVPLGPGDLRLFDALAVDGRAPAAELAEATGWSQTTVRRRMSELRALGALYFDLDLAAGALAPEAMRVGLWLDVEPARLAEVGAAMARHHEVAFVAATTGTANVYASVSCKDPGSLYRYVTGPVAALPGIRRAETAPVHRNLKGAGPHYAPRRDHPDRA
ncbi:Lrp/AsnC family transcriptional regulator [Actinacidiphila sp. DG2A-62]|uniref:Lrp/AsnC family transcriptional regulator n=1 Tax=Actinacidiphila sp. DG2A-62 TaxID=3108821 RepID=UPI002DBBC9A5|nr:Lrp/AsnC family transcriptional regulator [Actinacidiphila sp. DG2A-62]MEC3994161.1 Lrp/AsnC family transcriptional regulator [Actinacidiphila sp. DG2A-62]